MRLKDRRFNNFLTQQFQALTSGTPLALPVCKRHGADDAPGCLAHGRAISPPAHDSLHGAQP